MVLHGVMQVRNDGNEEPSFRQTKLRARCFTGQARHDSHSIEIESVVMLHDPSRVDAFPNQLVSNHLAVSDDAVGQAKRCSLGTLLHGRAKAVRLAFRGDARGHACPK